MKKEKTKKLFTTLGVVVALVIVAVVGYSLYELSTVTLQPL